MHFYCFYCNCDTLYNIIMLLYELMWQLSFHFVFLCDNNEKWNKMILKEWSIILFSNAQQYKCLTGWKCCRVVFRRSYFTSHYTNRPDRSRQVVCNWSRVRLTGCLPILQDNHFHNCAKMFSVSNLINIVIISFFTIYLYQQLIC